ncbi:MAG: preprotein translocase subunit SecG [Pirellulales bacterium]|nr:preprotein translocase subunit SecG [Pirellulales bacterium]
MNTVFMVLLLLTASFLILIILVQRGKGGGLAGAFGGMGGQSAFGAKAGDLFTKITIGVASLWIVLCLCCVAFLSPEDRFGSDATSDANKATQGTPADQPASDKPVTTPPPEKSGS